MNKISQLHTESEGAKSTQHARRMCVLVLGMHRSGTSALTRVVNLLGCDLPKTLMVAGEANESGYWESTEVYRFNDRLLESAGSCWYDWQQVNPGWFQSVRAEQFAAEALAVLKGEFDASPLFVLKDPRICRFAPFWLNVLDRARIQPLIVVPLRNPLEVAASLRTRDGFELSFSHLLWLRHVLEAEAATRGRHRLFSTYDQMLTGWAKVAMAAQSAFGMDWPRFSDSVVTEIDAFLSGRYRHHREAPESVVDNQMLSSWLRESFDVLTTWSRSGEREEDYPRLDRIRSEFNGAAPAFSRVVAAGRVAVEKAASLERSHKEIVARLAEVESAASGFQDEARAALARAEVAEQGAAALAARLGDVERDLVESRAETRAAEALLADVRAARPADDSQSPNVEDLAHELSNLRAVLAGAKEENLSLTSRLVAAKTQIAELEKERKHVKENTTVLTNQVAALQHEKRTQADIQARNRVDVARKEAAEAALTLRTRTEMRRARRWVNGLPFLLLSPTTRRHLRRAADERLIHSFLEKFDHHVVGVGRQGREDRILKYLIGMTDSLADFPLLQNTEYWEMYADVASTGMLPLVHWLRHGRKEGRNVHPLLDTAYYSSNVPAANAFSSSPAEHYLKWGVLQRQNPHPLFDTIAYLERYPDVAQRGVNALCHFLHNPRCVPNWLFDPNYYLNENPDVAMAGRNAVTHYMRHGWREGRNPHPFFDTRYYLSNNPDVVASGINPLQHFLTHGALEHRRTSPNFDPEFYLCAYPDIAQGNQIPLRHFLEHGIREGRAPHDTPPLPRPVAAIADSGRPVAVMIDAHYPRPKNDSGSIDQIVFAKIFKSLGFEVHYISLIEFGTSSSSETVGKTNPLQEIGVVCVSSEQHAFIEEYFFVNSKRIAVVFASRVHFGGAQIGLVRTFCPDAKVIFNTVDLHYLREERQGQVTGSEDAINRAKATKEQEFGCIREADATIVISQAEKEILAAEGLTANVFYVPLVREFNDRPQPGFTERKGIAFVGGFKHQPNIDAVEYLLSKIWPQVLREHPEMVLEIIGADMPPELAARRDAGVRFVGYVEDLDAHLGGLKATIAPLRYGAGAKGKIISSIGIGVPVIASRVAAEGMGFEPDRDIIIADTPDDYVAAIAALHNDRAVWQQLSRNGRERVRRDYSFDNGLSLMKKMLVELGVHLETSADGN